MKRLLLTFILILAVGIVTCQQLHTYTNKNYETPGGETGTQTYTYYVAEDGNYVKHGKYSVSANLTINKVWSNVNKDYISGKVKYTANASYKDGWLNGPLTITYSVQASSYYSRESTSIVNTLTANYVNGIPHGQWKMTSSIGGKIAGGFTATFSNGMLVGTFDIKGRAKGQFNQQGEFIGKWTFTFDSEDGERTTEYNFNNRCLVSYFNRINGTVVDAPDNAAELRELSLNYSNGQLSVDSLKALGYEVRSNRYSRYDNPFFDVAYMEKMAHEQDGEYHLYLDELGGDKTRDANTSEKRMYGKEYTYLHRMYKKFDTEEAFNKYVEYVQDELENEYFEDIYEYHSSEDIWNHKYVLTAKQKQKMKDVYNNYITNIRTGKLTTLYSTKAKNLIKTFVNLSQDNGMDKKKIESELRYDRYLINTWEETCKSASPILKTLEEHLKNFWPIANYTIDSCDISNMVVTCTIEKYEKEEGMTYWQTQVYFDSGKVDLDRSFIFANAKRIRGVWDELRDLRQKTVQNDSIIMNAGNDFKNVIKAYTKYKYSLGSEPKTSNLNAHLRYIQPHLQMQQLYVDFIDLRKKASIKRNQIVNETKTNFPDLYKSFTAEAKNHNISFSENIKASITRLNNLIRIEDGYLNFAQLRKTVTSKQSQITTASGKEYSDVTKAFSSFIESYDQSISADLKTCFDRLNALIAIEDSCLKFIDLRKQISTLNGQIMGNKTCKNLTKIYANYLKTTDLSWNQDATANGKLLKVINVQQQVLSIISKPDAKEKDTQVKKMKGLTLEEILRKLQ